MTVLPTIERELRAQSRLPFNHVLRALGAGALLLVALVFLADDGLRTGAGGKLLGLMNGSLFLLIWLMVPIISADCLSSERRLGTLGLLFLTPLKSRDIVVAKVLVNGIRAFVLWLAAVPVLALPFLAGGVGWREGLLSLMIGGSSICCALGAGLVASSLSRQWLRAQVLACVLAAGLATVMTWVPGAVIDFGFSRPFLPNADILHTLGIGFVFVSDFHGEWALLFAELRRLGVSNWWWIAAGGMTIVFSMLALAVSVEFAGWRLRRVWREEPPSVYAQRAWVLLSTPVLGTALLRGWLHRKLERNPIGWLETRTWTGRTVMWSWFAVMVSFYAGGLSGTFTFGRFYHLQDLLAILLMIGMAASAAGSFQRERETGVMELLLVSPMTEGQIISGRVRGLWGQFLPAVGLLLIVWVYITSLGFEPDEPNLMRCLCVSYLVIPVIGLYFSLRRRNFLSAFLLTFATAILFPAAFAWMIGFGLYGLKYEPGQSAYPTLTSDLVRWISAPASIAPIQLLIGILIARRLYWDLKQRNFAFSRAVT